MGSVILLLPTFLAQLEPRVCQTDVDRSLAERPQELTGRCVEWLRYRGTYSEEEGVVKEGEGRGACVAHS